ncbi:hypothetical protein V1511DRAFT_502315 [Dipodascopsis uninucleata]
MLRTHCLSVAKASSPSLRFGGKIAVVARLYSTESVPATKSSKNVEMTEEEKIVGMQAPNRLETWAESQQPRSQAMVGARFAQKDLSTQPRPYAAIELIAEQPIRMVESNIAVCDGGRGVQGHPKVFINLDMDGPNTCTYCGLRFQQKHHH